MLAELEAGVMVIEILETNLEAWTEDVVSLKCAETQKRLLWWLGILVYIDDEHLLLLL